MTEQEAYKMIMERAKEIAANKAVEEKAKEMHLNGMSWDEIETMIYRVAIATLYGIDKTECAGVRI